jgi:HEAT repeat protein
MRAWRTLPLCGLLVGGSLAAVGAHAQDDDILVDEDADLDDPGDAPPAPPTPVAADTGTLENLTRTLAQHSSFKVRATAAVALGRLTDPRGVPALISAIETDPHFAVRAAAASGLGRLGDPRAIDTLLGALVDGDGLVRTEARDALTQFHRHEHLGAFEEASQSENPRVRRAAVNAFGDVLRTGRASAAEVVIRALGDEDDEVLLTAARALNSLGHERVLPLLLRGLSSGDSSVRARAAALLTKHSDERALKPLMGAVRRTEERDDVRVELRRALQAHAEYIDTAVLLGVVRDAEATADQRVEAMRTLAVLGGEPGLAAVNKALLDEEGRVRAEGARGASDHGSPAASQSLERAIAREADARVRRQMELVQRRQR